MEEVREVRRRAATVTNLEHGFSIFHACFRFFVASFSFRSETQKHHHSDSHARGPPQPQATQNELHSIESYNGVQYCSLVYS